MPVCPGTVHTAPAPVSNLWTGEQKYPLKKKKKRCEMEDSLWPSEESDTIFFSPRDELLGDDRALTEA